MKKKISIIIALTLLCFSCSIDEKNKTVKTGEKFNVGLCSYAVEGYEIKLMNENALKKVALIRKSIDGGFLRKECCCGVELWNFKAIGKGNETLIFKYFKSHGDSLLFHSGSSEIIKYYIEVTDGI
ncbi:hypothetical protein [Flammeovirga aprica]|uniref:Uncharacterized protein n=1 Tax=Flammeovirga aprica JL-4 TaxID=694437 RepID=A0A7X9RYQ5_9BACT|nr:hypothetical protein [Flammeovirga aprica]NME71092.1 hypothetical protein [Flammeovirga aprica JL-4]